MAWLRRWRLSIPLQYLGWAITLARALCLYLLLAVMVWHLHPHWLVWALYWWTAGLALAAWALYSLLDVDGDGAEAAE